MAARSGATSGVEIVGVKEFRRALKRLGSEWPKELRRVHKEIGDLGLRYSQAEARLMGGVQARSASALRSKANQRSARIGVTPGRGAPMANVAFWGAKAHTGWYAKPRYRGGPPQHPPWVGNTWEAAVMGQGPYAINPALARHMDEILDAYAEAIDRLADAAFPEQ